MNARLFRAASLLLTLAISGCSLSIGGQLDELDVEPGTPSIARPAVACLPEAGVAVGGSRPADTRIIAIIRPAGAAATTPGVEVELAPIGADVVWSGTLSIADEGDYGVAVVAENGAGTRSLQSSTITVRVDRTAPAAPTGTFPATAETGALEVALGAGDDVDSIDCGTGASVSGADGVFAGTFTIVKDDNAFACIATDVCGLTSPSLDVAITGREITTLASPTLDPVADVRLAAGATEAEVVVTGTAVGATRVLATIDADSTSTVVVDADGDFVFAANLAEGSHLLTFVASDDDEDTNDSRPVASDVDVLPALSAPSITCPASPTNATSLTVTGDKAVDTGIVVDAVAAGANITATVPEDATTNWTATLAVGEVADGTLSISARSVVGADVSVAETCAVVIDRTAPALAQLDPIAAIIDRGTTQGEVDFAGSGEVGATVRVSIDGGAASDAGTVDADGRFAFSRVVGLAGNPHRVAVTLTDVAGNASTSEQTFTVIESLAAPSLRAPSSTSFPVHTNLASITLEGNKGSNAGIKLRPSDGGADIELVAIDASTTWTASLPLPANATTRFCLLAFSATETSPLRCRSGSNTAQPYEVIQDNQVPLAPVVVIDTTVQQATVVATITKEADAALLQARNGVVSTIDTGSAGVTVTPTLNLDLGTTTFCFTQRDKAGNLSDESCVDIRRSDARLDIAAPETFAIVNGTTLAVAASMFDTTATSYSVCVTTGTATPVCTEDIAAGAGGVLATTVPLGPAPTAATVTTVEICGDDGEVLEPECATRQVVRIAAPEQVSTSVTDTAKNDPQVAIDALGFIHLAWTDGNVCSTGHSDVITTISRNASNRVTLRVSRPNELGLAVNGTFTVFGTTSFDGAYTVASITNGEVVTRTTLQNGAPETRGNILTDAVKLDCQATDILYTRFDDRGWSRPVNLSDVGGDAASTQPTIAVDGAGDVHVAWTEAGNLDPSNGTARSPVSPADGGGRSDIVHVVIDGLTGAISRPLVVSRQDDTVDGWVNDQAPALAANGDDVVVVWESFVTSTTRRVLLSRFDGTSWSTPIAALGTATTTTPAPAVAVGPSGIAYVTWSELGGRSLDNGTVGVGTDRDIVLCPLPRGATSCLLNTDVLVSTGSDTGVSADAAIAVAIVDGLEVVDVIWTDNESRAVNDRRLRHRRLQLVGGETRSLGTPLTITNSGVAATPVIVVGEGSHDPLVVYTDNSVTAAHPRFSFRSLVGVGTDTATVSFAAPALVFTGTEVTTSATFTPAVAVTAERGAWFAVSQAAQTGVPDSEIFVYATNY